MIYTTDDVCPSNLIYWHYWDKIKLRKPDLEVIAFTIANYRNQENVSLSDEFKRWFDERKDWVEIGVHGLDHLYPPECERDNQEELIIFSLKILKDFLPKNPMFRAPGFQVTCKTEPILKRLGFRGIAHQSRIKYFDGTFDVPFNTHCCSKWHNPITEIWERI